MISYTNKINVPQYNPTGKSVGLKDCVSKTKYNKLIKEINNSNLSEDEKDFLKISATRHFKFNYSNIAEYYCNASKEMQELMEKSALVIIDVDDAIANGYMTLGKKVKDIIKENTNER